MTPLKVIAEWLWSQSDQIDFDDMGAEAAIEIVKALDAAGYKIAPKAAQESPAASKVDTSQFIGGP